MFSLLILLELLRIGRHVPCKRLHDGVSRGGVAAVRHGAQIRAGGSMIDGRLQARNAAVRHLNRYSEG